jgi:LPXTG-motif cell wall-anchored protein
MAFEDMDANVNLDETPPPEESSNRPFLVVAAILGAITLFALVCIAAYALYYVPKQSTLKVTQMAEVNTQNTEVAKAIELTSQAEAFTSTPTVTATPLPATPVPTKTPVVVIPTNTTVPTQDPRTATVAALLTQAAQVLQKTVVPTPTTTALPTTGFADQVGVPGLIGLAILLLVVIFLSRRLRTTG